MKINIVDIKITTKDKDTKRFRTKQGSIVDLANSIYRLGLLHPIVVDELKDDPKHKWILIAGERRLKACIMNGFGEIEATLFKDTTDVSKKEMELEENIMRKNLEWPEEVEALRQLDELKRKIYGSAHHGQEKGEGWSFQDTADSIGSSVATVHRDITLAKNIREHPDLLKKVAKMPKSAARKIVLQELEARKLAKQVATKQMKVSSELRHGNCVSLIKELESDSIHLLLTDPPFAAPTIAEVANSSGSSMTYNVGGTNVSTPALMENTYKELIPEIFRVLKPTSHIYIFFGHYWYFSLVSLLRKEGFIVDDQPLIWDKGRPSIMAKDMHYMSCYEAILFGYKPPAGNVLRNPTKNVLSIPAIAPQNKIHGLQRPHDLLKILIENSTSVGETVLDCFAGSGSTIKSAKMLQRSAIGFELDKGNYLRAQKFIQE